MNRRQNKSLRRRVRKSYLISTVSIALVLFLLGGVAYLILNAMKATDRLRESVTVYVMLRDGLTESDWEALRERIAADPTVLDAVFVAKSEAAEKLREYIGSDFETFLSYNPLPDSFEVSFRADAEQQAAVRTFERRAEAWAEVDEVFYQRNVLEQIGSNINKFTLVLLLFGGALLVISLILLNNTIRMAIFAKRYLINTMKLVGATRWFIVRPFVRSALAQGFWAALIAAVLFMGMVAGLDEGLPEVNFIAERSYYGYILGGMLLGGLLISGLFTIFAVNKFVRMRTDKVHFY